MSVFLSLSGSRLAQAQEEESAVAKAHPAAPQASGPVDITADEQEFANDSVIARGKVRVLYKDSTILAPLATLYKDESGNPNRAVFTGHPRLIQGHNKMDANMLTFEMQKQKVVAVGNAHSEVDIPEDQKDDGLSPKKDSANKFPPPPVPTAKAGGTDSDDDDDKSATPANEGTSKPAVSDKQAAKPKQSEKIITDSERQEFDQDSGKFEATGHVKLLNGDMTVLSDKMQVIYSATTNKPETCLFSGHVIATQGKNSTCADTINYSLSTRRLQASGNVKSKVIQEKKEEVKKKTAEASVKADLFGAPASAATRKPLSASASTNSIAMPVDGTNNKPIWIYSDSQEYNRDGGRVAATGNVRVVNGDMYGCGPSIVLTKKPDGKADKVYFIGRGQITQPGRRWIADEITYVVDEKKVIASGNASAFVVQNSADNKPKHKVIPVEPVQPPSRLAGSRQTLSSKPVATPK